ncbi:MAG: SDR family oxidoreductase [Crocinitomicaceae bacterium]|nr:SDR family oxidoreductase [Crocinitomicaceae bacterium]MDG1776828.1 SDR family oxidoreductase [Crocinitomicaceae bacterium]
MDQKVILITGASGGMGGAISTLFSTENVKLALQYNRNKVKLETCENVAHFQADLTDELQVSELIERVLLKFGRIDVLINNAGVSHSAMSWKTEASSWKETMAINLDAPFFLSKHVTPHFRAKKSGRIINITSVVAQTGFVGTAAYAASKAGLIGLTKTLSKELVSSGITVNALALGYFNVGMIEDVPADLQEQIIRTIPAGRLGDPKSVFKTIKWLVSDEGDYITGQTINLNGGLYS